MNSEKQITLVLTGTDLDIIGAGLGKLPYEAVAGLFEKIRHQFNQQASGLPVEAELAPASFPEAS